MYYVRGHFISNSEEALILDPYSEKPSFLVGFSVTEELVTPEEDTSLLDNSTGSSNFAAKGAHRLKLSLSLVKKPRSTVDDENFIQLMDVKDGVIRGIMDKTPYAELERTFARRTFDESGDYTVKPFEFDVFESVTINENVGRFALGDTTDAGNTAATDLLALKKFLLVKLTSKVLKLENPHLQLKMLQKLEILIQSTLESQRQR